MSGTDLGRYHVVAKLGEGGMGEVYRATDTVLRRSVALKRLAPHLAGDEAHKQRLLREARSVSALNHPNIASLFDVFEAGGETFLVMELVAGESLRARLARPLSLEDSLKIVRQCAEALAAAHRTGFLHRDIKPENILVDEEGRVKILDFGLAQRLPLDDAETASTETGTLGGTPRYLAPEVLERREPDAPADIFSLGIVFYEMLAGRHPFEAPSVASMMARILTESPLPPSRYNSALPEGIDRIVAQMLARDPAQRYPSARDLLAALEQPERAPALPQARLRLTRRAWMVAVVSLVMLVVALIFAVPGFRERVQLWLTGERPPRIPVAVLPFQNTTGNENLDRSRMALTQNLVAELTGSPNIRVLDYERLYQISSGIERSGKDLYDRVSIQSVASFAGARYVVVPVIYRFGDTLRASLEFKDGESADTLRAARVESEISGSGEETLLKMLAGLSDEIEKHFQKLGPGEEYQARARRESLKNPAVAVSYNEGMNALYEGRYAEALKSFDHVIQEDPTFALAYAWMGKIYGMLGYDEKALELSEKAAQLITAHMPIIDAYFIEANLAERKYDFAAAEQKYLDLIRVYEDDPVWHAGLAGVYEKQGEFQKAIARYEGAIRIDPNYIVAYQQLGSLYGQVRDFPRALANARKAHRLYVALGNREGEATALTDLGTIFWRKGEYGQARENFQAALAIFQELRNQFGILLAHKLLGDASADEGKLKEALDFYQQALARSGEIQNNRSVAVALMNIGSIYYWQGNYAKTIDYYRQSLQVAERYRQDRRTVQTLSNLGSVLIQHGPNREQGLQYVQEALSLFERMGDKSWEAFDRMLIGVYHSNAGHYAQAMDHLRRALAIAQAVDDKSQIADITYNIARCQFFQNQYALARDSLKQALELSRSLNAGRNVARAQILLGRIDVRLGEFDQARTTLTAAVQVAEENQYGDLLPGGYTALGELGYEEENRDEARKHFRRAAALWTGERPDAASVEAKSYLGLLQAERGNIPQALSDCQTSFDQAQRMGRAYLRARTRLNLARVYLWQKEYVSTIQTLDEMLSPGEVSLGPELLAQAYYVQSQALQRLGRADEARRAYEQAQEVVRRLQQTIPESQRENFAARRDIRPLLP
ncbi:MAG: tetratricopeptide repeat protein [Terriglobia bacterium]